MVSDSSHQIIYLILNLYFVKVLTCYILILFDNSYLILNILFIMTVMLDKGKLMIQMRRSSQKECLHGE